VAIAATVLASGIPPVLASRCGSPQALLGSLAIAPKGVGTDAHFAECALWLSWDLGDRNGHNSMGARRLDHLVIDLVSDPPPAVQPISASAAKRVRAKAKIPPINLKS
jgi:hypothetical protein